MSVQNQTVKNVYTGNGSTTVFPYTFDLLTTDGAHVGVYVTNDAGVSEPTDNFTIDTTAKTVTYPKTGDALPSDKKIVIRREIPNEQELNLVNGGEFFADDIEGEMDREVMMIQQLQEEVDRAVKIDPASEQTQEELLQDIFDARDTAVEKAAESAENVTKSSQWAEGTDADVAALGGTHSAKGWAAEAGAEKDDAHIWAEGTDGQVTPLGGTHSSKGWAEAAEQEKDDAHIWAEGTDAQVVPLGGTHSSKVWAQVAEQTTTKRVYYVDTMAAMRADSSLTPGMLVETKGYYAANDDGAGTYNIRAAEAGDTDDGGSTIILNNGFVAELLHTDIYNVAQWGIMPTPTSVSVGVQLQRLVNFVSANGGGTIQFNPGTYSLGASLNESSQPVNSIAIRSNVAFVGNHTIIKGNTDGADFYALFYNDIYNTIATNIRFENLIFDTYDDSVPYAATNDWKMPIVINSAKDVIVRNCTFYINSMAIEQRSGSATQTDKDNGNYHVENWLIEHNKFIFQIKSNLDYYDNTTVGLCGRNIVFRNNEFSCQIGTATYNKRPNTCVDINGQNIIICDNVFNDYNSACDITASDDYTGERNYRFEGNVVNTFRGVALWNDHRYMRNVSIRKNIFTVPTPDDHVQPMAMNCVALTLRNDQSGGGHYYNIYIEDNIFDYTNSYDYYYAVNIANWTFSYALVYQSYGGTFEQYYSCVAIGSTALDKDNIHIKHNTFIKSVFPAVHLSGTSFQRNCQIDDNTFIDGSDRFYKISINDYIYGVTIRKNTLIDTSTAATLNSKYWIKSGASMVQSATTVRLFGVVILDNVLIRTGDNTIQQLTNDMTYIMQQISAAAIDYLESTSAPSFAPRKPGLLWKDTTQGKLYISTGSTDASDWVLITSA